MRISRVLQNKLKLAAEELLKAANSHVESSSLDIGRNAMQELKKISKSSSDMTGTLRSCSTSLESNLSLVNSKLSNLQSIGERMRVSLIGKDPNLSPIESVQSNLEKMKKSIGEVNEKLSSLSSIQRSIEKMKLSIDSQSKYQRLDWAIENVKINTFMYSDVEDTSNSDSPMIDSEGIVTKILLAFRKDLGYDIPDWFYIPGMKDDDDGDDRKVAFRSAISKQIHELVGKEPAMIPMLEGRYKIIYSQ